MKNLKRLFAILMAVFIYMPAFSADRVDSKIRFNDLYGEVKIRPNSEEDDSYWVAELDTVIYEDDRIKTEEESGAILGLEDLSTYVIKPESVIIIHNKDGNINKLEILAGDIWGNIKKSIKGDSIEMEMSQCVAGLKGTIIRLHQSKDRILNRIDVVKGLAEVRSKINGNIYHVPAGKSLTIKASGESNGKEVEEVKEEDIDKDKVKEDFTKDLEKMDNKLDTNQIKEKLLEQTQGINSTRDGFETSYKTLESSIKENVQTENLDALSNLAKKLESLRLETSRFKGAIEELNVTISVASAKSTDKMMGVFVKQAIKARDNCIRVINKVEQLVVFTKSSIEKITNKKVKDTKENTNKNEKTEKNNEVNKPEIKLGKAEKAEKTELLNNNQPLKGEDKLDEAEIAEIIENIETITTDIENVSADAKDVMDTITDGSSYADIKNAVDVCENTLNNLNRLSAEISKLTANSQTSSRIANLKKYYDSTYKRVQEAMKKYASVPEINTGTLKTISDIENDVPSYASEVRKYLAEYKSIDKKDSSKQKRYVEAVTKVLANYDKMGRSYTKANKMYTQIQKSFKNSNFKTAEYDDVVESWEKIERAMTELDNEASELSEAVEKLKEQLEEVLSK